VWSFLFFIALAGLVAAHFVWRRRFREVEDRLLRLQRENAESRAHEERARGEISAREETLLNSISEGILFLDAQGRITGANEAVARMFNPAGPLKGKTLLEAFRLHPLVELVNEIQESGRAREMEIALAGAPQRFFEVSGSTLRRPGGAGIILTFHDITRLKQLENMRKEFVANVSHELRTPLTLIKGFAETLLDGAMDDPAAAQRFVTTIQRNAERLALIIDDLLTISSLESGQMGIEKQSLRLHALVERVVTELQASRSTRTIKIQNLVPPEVVVCADLQRLQQVLTNLLDNALKYGRDHGYIKISARMLPDGGAQISVADDGPGIPREALERIFERFYRVDRARSRDQGGTGLGLSIVKHIVQAHRGRVWAESELEKGSTFHITLPSEYDFASHAAMQAATGHAG
jgi:two-component system, OmpR family, phosphate regulon sensor histidine kinase PhoR